MPKLSIDIEARFAQATDALNTLSRQAEGTSKKIETAFNKIKGAVIGGVIAQGVTRFGKAMFEATIEAEKAQQQLQATLQATGYAAGLTAKELDELAEKYAKTTLFDDDDIRQAEVALLRFRDIQSEVFEDVIKVTLKLANAQGTTAAQAAQEMGRAIVDPVAGLKALKGVMTPLTQAQKDLIDGFEKTGDKAGVARVLIDQLNKSLGATPSEGIAAGANRVSKAWDDLLKSLGRSKAVGELAGGFLDQLSTRLNKVDEDLARVANAKGWEKIRAFLAALDMAHGPRARPEVEDTKGTFDQQIKDYNEFIAKQGEARRKLEQQKEAANKAAEEEATINAATAAVGHQATLAAAKQAAQAEQAALDDELKRGTVSYTKYYNQRVDIIHRATQAEIAASEAAQKAIEDKGARTPEERASKAAAVLRLEKERVALLKQEEADILEAGRVHLDQSQKTIDSYDELRAALAEYTGDYKKAADIRFELAQRETQNTLLQGERSLEEVDRLKRITLAQAQVRKTLEETGDTYADLARAERDIQNLRETGEITTQEALRRTDAARREQLETLDRLASKLEKEAASPDADPRTIEQAKEARQAIKDLRASSEQEAKQMRELFQNSMIDPFIDLVNQTKTADEALKGFFNNVAQSLLRLEAQKVAETVFGKKGLVGGFIGLFGTTTNAKGNVMTEHGPLQLERYARGGIARRPMVSIFGEGSMPEAYVPLPDGRAIPVQMRGQDGGRVMAGPSAVMQRQPAASTNVTLQLHPNAMHLTLRDWFEGEMSRQMATR